MNTKRVASNIVKKLKSRPDGINPIIDKLKGEFHLDANYDGQALTIGAQHTDILDLAVLYLQDATKEIHKDVSVTLGKDGYVIWQFRGKTAYIGRCLFRKEIDEMAKGDDEVQAEMFTEDIEIKCIHDQYKRVKEKVQRVISQIKDCKKIVVKVGKRDERLAKQFCNNCQNDTFCALYDESITFWGRTEKQCNEGKAMWEKNPSGSKNQTEKETKPPTSLPGAGATPRAETSSPLIPSAPPEDEVADAGKSEHTDQKGKKDSVNGKEVKDENKTPATIPQGADASQVTSRLPGKTTGSGDKSQYTFKVGNLRVIVYKLSITETKDIDGITNAANERMMHGGGVAYYISKAAGKKMDDECKKYIDKHGLLKVTENYVSGPGDIKCKGIIHAVGPQWWDYKDHYDDCAKDLHMTIVNILEATKKRQWTSVALPAISSGLFGVPKELCAEMYITGFAAFAMRDTGSVKDVHFLDLNEDILNMVKEAHAKWVNEPTALDFKNAWKYHDTAGTKTMRKAKESTPDITFVKETLTKQKKRKFEYLVAGGIQVYLYTGSVTDMEAKYDAITCPCNGRLASVIAKKVGADYNKQTAKYGQIREGEIFHINGGKGLFAGTSIIHVQFTSSQYDFSKQSLASLEGMTTSLFEYANEKVKSSVLALSMLVPEQAATDDRFLVAVIDNFIKVMLTCAKMAKKLNIKELHILDVNENRVNIIKVAIKGFTNPQHDKANSSEAYGKTIGDDFGSSSYKSGPPQASMYPDLKNGWIPHNPSKEKNVVHQTGNKETSLKKFTDKSSTCICEICSDSKRTGSKKFDNCRHMICDICAIAMKSGCTKCKSSSKGSRTNSPVGMKCAVCFDSFQSLVSLPCGHEYCNSCVAKLSKLTPRCPECQKPFGIITGNQPDGKMLYREIKESLQGFEECGTIEIFYEIFSGKQNAKHPNPGAHYSGVQRFAFLPNNQEGQRVFKLLKKAFDRRLIFTVGDSRTTGKEGVVTWNDIHHKTRPSGGPEHFGYPDPTYLSRVLEELAAKGVTE
ncbi:uncharacterized protein LOC128202988 [Mya arenaria]|uniref:uncharacterized protein LOC128202988 n=1 Tax=Mya arenaria TaxID=6604 RepID=UPI0022E299E5|nr:uncharacterized protein LOC128202988 [Mya arenaria]XP_052760163.1 uncharacterized protein LOC128202988 [Mya arenaria]